MRRQQSRAPCRPGSGPLGTLLEFAASRRRRFTQRLHQIYSQYYHHRVRRRSRRHRRHHPQQQQQQQPVSAPEPAAAVDLSQPVEWRLFNVAAELSIRDTSFDLHVIAELNVAVRSLCHRRRRRCCYCQWHSHQYVRFAQWKWKLLVVQISIGICGVPGQSRQRF